MKMNPELEAEMVRTAVIGAKVARAHLIPLLETRKPSTPKVIQPPLLWIYRATFFEALAKEFADEARLLRERFEAAPEPKDATNAK